jgi:isopenicillin-N epimerase
MRRYDERLWGLEAGVAHLNHGSYGAVPVPVREAQAAAARWIERSPERFYRERLRPALASSRAAVGAFLEVDPDAIALVENATAGVQLALDAIGLERGQEIVVTDHGYPWVRAAVERVAAQVGGTVRIAELPSSWMGGVDPAALVAAVGDALTPRTALVIVDQLTSGTALALDAAAVVRAVGTAVPVLVDGAHAPGLVDAPVVEGAAFWVGNLHKWAFAPRTAAVLYASPRFRARVRPQVASVDAGLGFPRAFDYLGTQDPSAYLALPAALDFPRAHLGLDFVGLRVRNRAVLAEGLTRLEARVGLLAAADQGIPMRTVALGVEGDGAAAQAWMERLWAEGVEVAVVPIDGALHLRLSCQAYVEAEDFVRLADVLAGWVG